MEAELPTRTEILEAIGIQLITPLFTETLLDIMKHYKLIFTLPFKLFRTHVTLYPEKFSLSQQLS